MMEGKLRIADSGALAGPAHINYAEDIAAGTSEAKEE
jgi:hypothetical protein